MLFTKHVYSQVRYTFDFVVGPNWTNNLTALTNNVRLSYGAGIVLRLGGIARLELNYCLPVWASTGDK